MLCCFFFTVRLLVRATYVYSILCAYTSLHLFLLSFPVRHQVPNHYTSVPMCESYAEDHGRGPHPLDDHRRTSADVARTRTEREGRTEVNE